MHSLFITAVWSNILETNDTGVYTCMLFFPNRILAANDFFVENIVVIELVHFIKNSLFFNIMKYMDNLSYRLSIIKRIKYNLDLTVDFSVL